MSVSRSWTSNEKNEVVHYLAAGILTLSALTVMILSLLTPLDAEAILLEPEDAWKYEVSWTWNNGSQQFVGLINPQIVIENETSDSITGFLADSRGNKLLMFSEEQVVMVSYQFESSIETPWHMADRLHGGNFSIPVTMDAYGLKYNGEVLDLVRIYIGHDTYTVNDGTLSSRQSQVFTSSAMMFYSIGSLSENMSLTNYGNTSEITNDVAPSWYESERAYSYNQTIDFTSEQYENDLDAYDDYGEDEEYEPWELGESPILFGFDDQIVEGNALGGAYFDYADLGAFDEVDGDITGLISCDPASGSFFEVNKTTEVFCAVTDSDGFAANQTFSVSVVDTTSPLFSSFPNDIVIQSDKIAIEVDYELPIATDLVDDAVAVQCDPSPHSYFSLGTTIVTCTTTDKSGNSISTLFTVNVQLIVPIDVMTSSTNNKISLSYETDISVAAFGTSSFDVQDIDTDTVYFGPEEAKPVRVSELDDISGDGLADILFTFRIADTGLYEGYGSEVCLGGSLGNDDIFLIGCDHVQVTG